MKKSRFLNLVNPETYQVFLFSSPCPFPIMFAVHTWFVINLKGAIHRWEFGKFRGCPCENEIGVLKDFLTPETGMPYFWWKSYPRFSSTLVSVIEGDEGSVAAELALFVHNHSLSYPLKHVYTLTGPNSNSFMQWILDKFPESGLKLPFNAFGKHYRIVG